MSVKVSGIYGENEYDSLLEALDEERIFKIEKGYHYDEPNTWALRERCDDCFCIDVTPDMIRRLAYELLVKADEMEAT